MGAGTHIERDRREEIDLKHVAEGLGNWGSH